MCVSAYVFRADGSHVECSNQGALADALGISLASLPADPMCIDAGTCLCPVDVRALATRLGMTCDDPEWEHGSDHFDAWALRPAVSQ